MEKKNNKPTTNQPICGKLTSKLVESHFHAVEKGKELLYFYSHSITDFYFKKACSLLCNKYS